MKKAIGIAITDGISKYNTKCTISSLINGYADVWNRGLPLCLNHDKTKFYGWTYLLSVYFESNSTKVTNISLFPENEREGKQIELRMQAFQSEQYKEEEHNFTILINKIKNQLSNNYKKILNGCVCVYDQDIIKKVIPNINDELDKDGLIEISKLKEIMPGVYEKEGFILFAHQYFRRGMSRLNTLNEPFFEVFSTILKLDNISAKIAIDFDIIGLPCTQHRTMEFQYWWGPKFSNTFSDIRYGVTLHKNEKYDRFFDSMFLSIEKWSTVSV